MPFRIEYGPDASLVGGVAQEAGLGKYRQQQQEHQLAQAKFMADQMKDQAQFMAQQQQRAVENQMRGAQMAEGAMKDRAEFGLRSQQAEFGNLMQQAKGYADYENQQQAADLRERQFSYGQERDASHEQMLRDFEGNRQESYGENRDLKLKIQEQAQAWEREKQQQKFDNDKDLASLKFSNVQKQQLATIDKDLAGLQSIKEAAGPLGQQPALEAHIARLEGQRRFITNEARVATQADEAAQAEQRQKAIAAKQTSIPIEGVGDVPHFLDDKGNLHVSEAWKISHTAEQKSRSDFFIKNPDATPLDYAKFQDKVAGRQPGKMGSIWGGDQPEDQAQHVMPQSSIPEPAKQALQGVAAEAGPQVAQQAADILSNPNPPPLDSLSPAVKEALRRAYRAMKAGNQQSAAPSSRGLRLHGVRIPDIGPSTAPEMLGSDALG